MIKHSKARTSISPILLILIFNRDSHKTSQYLLSSSRDMQNVKCYINDLESRKTFFLSLSNLTQSEKKFLDFELFIIPILMIKES